MNVTFFINSALLGVGLAMDAFSVSMANGLHEPKMGTGRMSAIAGVYAFFQFLMPMIGWLCVHTIVQLFASFERLIPWIALILLCFIGGRMIMEGLAERREGPQNSMAKKLSVSLLLIQGIATSIDALSVGFTIADYSAGLATVAALIIAGVTFVICMIGLMIGKKAGTVLSWKASILGGCILILIGVEIFVKGVLL